MAGFSKIYCIGGLGGFDGADGINPIDIQIWQGEGNRQWLEARYFNEKLKPLANLRTLIPESPNHPDALLDACIAFFPDYFKDCALLLAVCEKLGDQECLDFNQGKEQIPKAWKKLREQARPLFRDLVVFEAVLEPLRK